MPAADPSGSPSSDEALWFTVKVSTGSGALGRNHDDEFCVWLGTSYVLRDAKGGIVAAGEAQSRIEGEAEAGGGACADRRGDVPGPLRVRHGLQDRGRSRRRFL